MVITMTTDLMYIIDGSFEGLLTSVFEAFKTRRFPAGVHARQAFQQSLCAIPTIIMTDDQKAGRVRAGILKKLGSLVYEQVWMAYLSNDPERYTKVFRYLALAFRTGRSIADRLAEPAVLDVFSLHRGVSRELNKLMGFVRFSVMENGVQFSEITPENNQIPLLMPHFADRFPDIPFLLYDPRRGLAGIYDAKAWYLADAVGLTLPEYSKDERAFRALWKAFYQAVAVPERKNPRLQMNFMPKRYWRNMTEMRPDGGMI
ncbi:MAG: TIGR03915 family putative DNA repair protein [Clostridiales bacterium]|jgi:probable DNA metabolism protein|nr:TIGR03915 family putative DNA repair protein [Clostridiales bacterium]